MAVPKAALEAAERRAEMAEAFAFHRLAVDERDAERQKAINLERRLRLYVD